MSLSHLLFNDYWENMRRAQQRLLHTPEFNPAPQPPPRPANRLSAIDQTDEPQSWAITVPDVSEQTSNRLTQMPPITGINYPASNLPPTMPQSDEVQTSTNAGDIPTQAGGRLTPKVMVPPLPGRRGPAREDNGLNSREYEYVTEGMDNTGRIKRSGKDIAKAALLGAVQGLGTNGLGGALGGAAAGGLTAAINPTLGREMIFNQTQRPRLEREQAEDDQRIAQQRAERQAEQSEELRQAQIDKLYNDQSREKPSDRYIKLTDGRLYDTQTGKLAVDGPQKPERKAAPRWQSVEDESGNPTLVDLNAPENQGKKFKPYQKPAQPRAGNGRFATPKTAQPPARLLQSIERVGALRQAAIAAWDKAKSAAPAEKEQRERSARAAQQQYNDAAKNLGTVYGQHIEVGEGDGWAYLKPREQPQASGPARTGNGGQRVFPASELGRFAQENGIGLAEARKMITANGYVIR